MKSTIIAAAGLALALATLSRPLLAGAQSPSGDNDLAQPNPAAVTGRLPNGLRYTILQHPSHNKESLQFFVEAGSRDETDQELGAAHFLEHMAFISAKDFPASQLTHDFAQAGISWGRDQNASTTYFGTTYALNIPEVTDAKLALSFKWLGDVADGLMLDPAGVDRERGVVLQEYVRALSPAWDLGRRAEVFSSPDLRGAQRPPIGTTATINSLSRGDLDRFYHRWYRPENAILVAVGDEPAAAIKARIEATFGGWRASPPSPPRPGPGGVDPHRRLDVFTSAEPKLPALVQVCRFGSKDPVRPEGVASHRLTLADDIWATAFARRFSTLARSPSPPFVGASAGRSELYRAVGLICFSATPINDDWKAALKSLADELRRMDMYGVTQSEFDYVKSQKTTQLDYAVEAEPTVDATLLATNILYNYQVEETFDTAQEDRRIEAKALAQLDAKAATDAFRRRWNGSGEPLLVVLSPTAVAKDDVRTAWAADMASPAPPPPSTAKAPKWAYSSFGPPGAVSQREAMHDPDFVRLTFKNGVILNLKSTPFAKGEVVIWARFGAGQQEMPPGEIWNATMGAGWLLEGGLGKNTAEDLTDICKGRSCQMALSVGRTGFVLNGATRTEDLDLELQLLTAFLADPGFRSGPDSRIPSAVHSTYRQIDSNPMATAMLALEDALPKPHVTDLPPEQDAAALTMARFKALLDVPLRHDALEVTLVGDVDEADAVRLVGSTLGALPPRPRANHTRPDAAHTIFAPTPPPTIVTRHSGPKEKAAIEMSWPLFVWTEEGVHERRVFSLIDRVLYDEIIEEVRRKHGQTYTPAVGFSVERGGDQGSFTVALETSPGDIDAVAAEVEQIVSDAAKGAITSEMLEQARAPLLAARAKQRTYNGWWVEVLDGSAEHPENLANTQTVDHDLATISLAEIKAEAARRLSAKPLVVESLPGEGPKVPPQHLAGP
jgi:zinc protease